MKIRELLILTLGVVNMATYAQHNYGEALQKSLLFYETQQSGVLPDWNRISWRSDSGINDGQDVGLDLTGGWNDAGDHVKFGFPMAFSATALNWGFLEYQDGYAAAGQTEHFKRNIKWVTDYFIKCHPSPNVFYAQVADSKSQDHSFWMPAEMVDVHPAYGQRLSYALTTSNPGTDVACETAAALASASIIFKDSDPGYSVTLLQHAKDLYDFGDNYRGLYTSEGNIPAVGTYTSGNYTDELVWGALWLYKATGDESYLDKAKASYELPDFLWSLVWEDKSYGNMVLLSIITGEDQYKADAERHLDWWQEGNGGVSYSPGGQAHLTQWGSLRHAMNASLTALIYSDNVDTPKKQQYHDFAVQQVNYALGDNPSNRSLVTGFGVNPPTKPHHRGQHSSWSRSSADPVESRHTMWGALMGGPSGANDVFEEDRDDFQANEVATDYNACYQGVLARMVSEYGGTPLTNFPEDEVPGVEFANEVKLNQDESRFTEVAIWLNNRSGWPARVPDRLTARYFIDITEGIEAGFEASDYIITTNGTGGSANGGLQAWDASTNVYYVEVEVADGNMPFPGGQGEYRTEIQLRISLPTTAPVSAWDASNDFSYNGLTRTLDIQDNVPIYTDGELAGGNEPDGDGVVVTPQVPTASFTVSELVGLAPLEVEFNASASSDPNGDALTYAWDFGNGETSSLINPTIIFTEVGSYLVSLTVSDGIYTSTAFTETISVEEEPVEEEPVEGGTIEGGPFAFTVGDGIVDNVSGITLSGNEGDNSQWVVTDDSRNILGLPPTPEAVDFDVAGEGTCFIYHLSYNGELSGLEAGNNLSILDGNFDLSNRIDVVRNFETVTPVGTGDCTFNTPLSTALPSTGNLAYKNIHVLGTGGPNMDNVTIFTINWDLSNNGLYQFSFNLNVAPWWTNFSDNAQNFNQANPSITLTGTSIAGLDGTYYAAVDGDNFVLVADDYTIYFSNSATAPDCGDDGTTEETLVNGGTIEGGPFTFIVGDGIADNVSGITLSGNDGETSQWVVTDNLSNILGLPPTPETVDFDVAGEGTCFIYHLSYNGEISGLEAGNNLSILDGDYDLSNRIDVEREAFVDPIVINPVNEAPTANASASATTGLAPLNVTFDGSGSSDPEGDTLTYVWNFSDGTTATGVTTNKTFDVEGSFDVILTVTDVEGLTAIDTITVNATSETVNPGTGGGGSSDNAYIDRFNEMRSEIYDPVNGYFSADGSPHHSIETLIVEAPDYGHESTSELYSYWMWMEAMHGRISGDWEPLRDVWETTEEFIIPTNAAQPTNAAYNSASPAAYAPEFSNPSGYPAPLDFSAPTGIDPVSDDLAATYGPDVYQMHWLLDNDNFYGYGNMGDGVSTPSYINTFQRGEEESVYETIPHPSWESFDWGGANGFLPLFTLDANYSEQWRYTSATDADARAVQAMYWAREWATEQETSTAVLDLDKATKMGDYLRLGMFDKYFKPMGVQSATSGAGTGYDSAHYLMSWYISWGGAANTSSPWAFRISASHCHFGYQNPVAAYALTEVDEMIPSSQNGERDWGTSLGRQMEFYTWLQSVEGGIAGGATNSWNGDYSAYPAGKSTFYDMAYDDNPVYHDPGSGTWFGWQAWSMERVAEYYYITNDPTAKTLIDNWTTWVESEVQLVGANDFLIPATLEWTGEPDTWDAENPGSNSDLHVKVTNHNVDLGIAASTAKALIYYAAATEKYSTLDTGAQTLAKEILDRMWTTYRDDQGCSSPESRGDYSRIFEEEVYVPDGFVGAMGQGETIDQGVTFLDLRSGYLTDPEYPAVLEAYESGTDYTTNYHRTWAQMEIALANAEYGFFFGEDEVSEKSILPSNFNVVTYPNPAIEFVTVSVTALDDTVSGSDIVITNLLGQTIGTQKINEGETSTQVNVRDYPSGLYLLTVYKGSAKIKVSRIVIN